MLQGHETIWPLFAVCPHWEGYTDGDSERYREIAAAHEQAGFARVFNTAVTALTRYGTLEDLDAALDDSGGGGVGDGSHFADTWRTRAVVAVDFMRTMAYVHNSRKPGRGLNCKIYIFLRHE